MAYYDDNYFGNDEDNNSMNPMFNKHTYDKFDKGHKLVKRCSDEGTWKNVHVYVSSGVGSTIRDAETGQTYPGVMVGSKDEDLLFKVSIATGSNAANGLNTAFYQSPAHFVTHMHAKIGMDTEQRWNTKRIQRVRELALEESKRQERMRTVIY